MNSDSDRAVYRIGRFFHESDKPLIYRDTFDISDDRTKEILARCDLFGQATFAKVEIVDKNNRRWQMKPGVMKMSLKSYQEFRRFLFRPNTLSVLAGIEGTNSGRK